MEKEISADRKKAIAIFTKDIAALSIGILNTKPEELNFNGIVHFLELIKSEAEKIRDEVYTENNPTTQQNADDLSFDANLFTK